MRLLGQGGVFAFQHVIKTERKIYRAGVRFREEGPCGAASPACWRGQVSGLLPGSGSSGGWRSGSCHRLHPGGSRGGVQPLRDLELAEALAKGPASNSRDREGFLVLGCVPKFSQGLA